MDKVKMNEANRWLEKALSFEAEGKSAKIIDMALDKAARIEREALGLA